MMIQRFYVVAAVVFMLMGCGNGHNGHGTNEAYLPQPEGPAVAAVTTGEPGDRWLDTMQFVRVARAQHGGRYGYEASYTGPGGTVFTLFWSRDEIDFRGAAPRNFHLKNMPLGEGRLRYPNKITRESLPDVFLAIQSIERDYARYANGEITWAQALADIAALGAGMPGPRAAGAAGGGPPRIPPARASIPSAAKVGTKGAGRGFRSFEAFKRAMGPAGPGMQWHHVVEQGGSNVARFGAENIHNTANIVRLEMAIHQRVSGFYSSIQERITGSTTLTVRQWLSSQSFEAQAEFGLMAIENVRRGIW